MNSALPYSEIIKVRFRDTDSQGHLYFANYLVFADEITGFYMSQLGYNASNPGDVPCYIFTVNLNCDYLDECKALDEIRVFTGYTRLGNSSAEVAFELYRESDDVMLSKGSFTQVFVDKSTRKSCPIPTAFRASVIARQPELA
ncbi:MAG: thioesterase family protein [Halioglobus sp.]